MGDEVSLLDLKEINPELAHGFETMLQHDGDDFTDLYDQNFTLVRDGLEPFKCEVIFFTSLYCSVW